MWPSCFCISCAFTHGCFSSLKLQQEEIHLQESALQLLAQHLTFITEHITTSLSEGDWHFVMGHTRFRSPIVYAGGEAHPLLPAVWSQRYEGPSFSNSSAAPGDANTGLNFMVDIQTDIRPFKDAHKQQKILFTKQWHTLRIRRKKWTRNWSFLEGHVRVQLSSQGHPSLPTFAFAWPFGAYHAAPGRRCSWSANGTWLAEIKKKLFQ